MSDVSPKQRIIKRPLITSMEHLPLDFWIIIVHQILFQGMFAIKNLILVQKTGKKIRGRNIEAAIAIIYFAIFILASLVISYFNLGLGTLHFPAKMASHVTALGFIIINLIVSALSLVHLKDSWRVGVIENQKTELITGGIYSISRNPYFLSYFLMFLGYTLLLQNLILLVLSFIGIFLVHKMIIKEEKYLYSIHGDSYLEYKSKVPRYFII